MNPVPAPMPRAPQAKRAGVTLVEMMVAATILTFVCMAFITALLQNKRMSLAVAYRTEATTAALDVAEQLRASTYSDVGEKYVAPATVTFQVDVLDPTFAGAVNGRRTISLPINTKDGVIVNSLWTQVDLPFTYESTAAKHSNIKIPVRYWLSVRLQQTKLTNNGIPYNQCDLYEMALVYQWRNPNRPNAEWQSGVVRLVNANRDMNPTS